MKLGFVSANGSVRTPADDFDPGTLKAMLTANGRESVDDR
jgi:hypothetical protein